MSNSPKFGFTLLVERRGQQLSLCRGLPDREAAVSCALTMGAIRPVGLEGMVIRCEQTQERWTVEQLVTAEERSAAMGSPAPSMEPG